MKAWAMDSMDRLSEQLLTACNKGLASLVPLLLKKGASVNWSRSDGWTPLMSACSGGHLTVAQLLLDAGASVDAAAADGFTALMEACTAGRLELVDLLLEHQASIGHATPSGRTAVILASLYGHTEVVELLLNHHADCRPNKFTALHAASGNGQSAVVEILLRTVTVDAEEASGAFISACANGHLQVAQLLLQHGVSPCVSSSDGTTALMKACMGSHRDVAAELILHGASVEDALSTARRSKMPGVMRVLHRAVEEAMSRSGSEARDLDDLVQSIEGKKLEKTQKAKCRDRIFRSHFSVASSSTALAASEGATESPGRPEAEAEASATENEDIDEADILPSAIEVGKGSCHLTGASWFKPSFGEARPKRRQQVAPDEPDLVAEPEVYQELAVPWDDLLQRTAAHFPETTANRLSQLAYGSNLQMPQLPMLPLYKTACYTIEVLMEEPPSPIWIAAAANRAAARSGHQTDQIWVQHSAGFHHLEMGRMLW